jgi:DNA-binding transcriptional ArsR family regulator
MSAPQLAAISRLFAVLSEPSRLVLLQALHGGPLTVSQLVKACAMKQANVSKHLGVLHDHRLVKRKREGISIRYEIADPMIFSLCNLVCGKMERDTKCAAALFHPEI